MKNQLVKDLMAGKVQVGALNFEVREDGSIIGRVQNKKEMQSTQGTQESNVPQETLSEKKEDKGTLFFKLVEEVECDDLEIPVFNTKDYMDYKAYMEKHGYSPSVEQYKELTGK